MGRLRTRLAWLASCALLLAAPAPAQAVVLRTAAQEGTEPKFIAAGRDRIVGLCIDILRAIEQTDPNLKFTGDQKWMPLIRAYAELASGRHDVQCAMQRSPEREQKYHFFGPPLFNVEYHFLVRMQDPVVIHNWSDVRKLTPKVTVLVNRGFAAADILHELGGIEVDASSSNPELNLQKLVAGRGRLYFHRSPGLSQLLARTGTTDKVKILPQVMYSSTLYFAASKQLAPEVIERIEQALVHLNKSGELDRMIRKWD